MHQTYVGFLAVIMSLGTVWWDGAFGQAVELPNQYKRVHQNLLKQILRRKLDQAVIRAKKFLEQYPEDAETWFILAVAECQQGNLDQASDSARRALQHGLPASRFACTNMLGIEKLHTLKSFQDVLQPFKVQPVHGPMLGDLRATRVSVWIRTLERSKVRVIVWPDSEPQRMIPSATVQTSASEDFTAKIRVAGLKPDTAYHYRIEINGQLGKATFRFRTPGPAKEGIRLRIAFGGGAGYVPPNESVWSTIRDQKPDLLFLLGDNVYIDDPTTPQMQRYCYYRRQSRPEFRRLVAEIPVYSIWDDHDFGTNDCSGGPAIEHPTWKRSVYHIFRRNWVNPAYGGGDDHPGCYYDFSLGDIHFVMLDGRYYRDPNAHPPSMLGPVQRTWLLETLKRSEGKFRILCSPVPWVYRAKGDSKDTWNGFREERTEIFDWLFEKQIPGVFLLSADRHRSDLWKIDRSKGYSLYEACSSRLTNQHVHRTMKQALFSYNAKQSFGLLDLDTTLANPQIIYRIISIDGEEVYQHKLCGTQLGHPKSARE